MTWRIKLGKQGSEFVKLKAGEEDAATTATILEDLESGTGTGRGRGSQLANYAKRDKYMIRNALQNKETIKKLLKSAPIPWDFVRFGFLCLFVAMVSIGTIIATYVTFISLFTALTDQMEMVKYEIDTCRCLHESAGILLQPVLYNEYANTIIAFGRGLLSLKNMYPNGMTSGDAALTWTRSTLRRLVSELKSNLYELKNSPYESLTGNLYQTTTSYTINGTNLNYVNFSVLMSYELVPSALSNNGIVLDADNRHIGVPEHHQDKVYRSERGLDRVQQSELAVWVVGRGAGRVPEQSRSVLRQPSGQH